MSRISFGQPVELCSDPDKWALLDALTRAAEAYGLNHRSLTVLRALLSCHPQRGLPTDPGAAVVYPSNRTLSARLNGMPESTLRRHLAALVRSGLVRRQDSANGKRFCRSGGLAFGFDLSPLARAVPEIAAHAEAFAQRDARIASLRAQLAATRQRLLDQGIPEDDAEIEETRLTLRRKVSADVLESLLTALENRLDNTAAIHLPADNLVASHSGNERHIQTTDKSDSVSKTEAETAVQPSEPHLPDVLARCHEYKSYFPDTRPDWTGVLDVSDRLQAMMGIDRPVYDDARAKLGARQAAAVILCMLEQMHRIKRPGAYLRGLIQRAERGLFNMAGMLRALPSEAVHG